MKKCISSLFTILLSSCLLAQNIPLDSWRTHFSYTNGRLLTKSEDKIFCAVENGLFSLDLTDNSLNPINKTDGLSDAGISALEYDQNSRTLVIGYPSGLVDLVTENEIVTLREINETNKLGDKQIEDVSFYNGNAFLSTNFGILVINLELQEITDTYSSIGPDGTDVTVFETEVIGEDLFAITNLGIQWGALDDNLLDFNNWTHYENPENNEYKGFAVYAEQIYSIENNTSLVTLQNQSWEEVPTGITEPLVRLYAKEDGLFILTTTKIYQYTQSELTIIRDLGNTSEGNDLIFSGGFWVVDRATGLLDPEGESISPNGPLADGISKIRFTGNKAFTFYGPAPLNYFGQTTHNQYSVFENGTWTTKAIEGFHNISDVANFRGELYFSSIGFGLYHEASQEILNHTSGFSDSKSGLGVIIPELAVSNLLYIPAFNSSYSLYVLNTDGELTAYPESYVGTDDPVAINLSQNNVLWLTRSTADGGGIITLDLDSDDFRLITANDNLPSANIQDISINRSDEAWVATSGGPSFFSEASFIFQQVEGVSPIFEGFDLFEGQQVSAIATDGGNRIWMATREGVFVFDEAISEQIHHFTIENSPLPSNTVREFAYDPGSGEMFILTDKGLVSYRSSSSNPSPAYQDVKIFPNPVRPGYMGLVGISGIADGADVKITDVNGKLIRELKVNGGTASWNLRDYNNRRVSDGIYVILSASGDGSEKFIGKIAVLN